MTDHLAGEVRAAAVPAIDHFGERVRPGKYGHRLTRDKYALVNRKPSTRFPREDYSDARWEAEAWAFEDEEHTRFSDEFCEDQRAAALANFDLNMAFFAQLSGRAFLEALNEMLGKHRKLQPVTDLRTMDGAEGVYVMVLDRYKQAYVGEAWDIRARIKRHWAGTHPFDRLIFGHMNTSVLSIDSFRARDTTRIFAAKTRSGLRLEERLIDTLPPDFLLNRVPGGERFMGNRFLPSEVKRRQLVPAEVRGVSGEGASPLI